MRNRLKKELGAAAKPEKEERSEEGGDIALVYLVDPGHYRSEQRSNVFDLNICHIRCRFGANKEG